MKKKCDKFKIGTFNVRSIKSEVRQNQLSDDVNNYNIDVLCIQETKIVDGLDINVSSGRLICLKTNSHYYGCGFIIHKRWVNNIHRFWRVSDRVSVLQIKYESNEQSATNASNQPKVITIINVYGPTLKLTSTKPEIRHTFYKELQETIDKIGKKTYLVIAGDFNSKIGKQEIGEICLGRYSKGKRNENGEKLIEFCNDNNLFLTNSAFPHPSRHQTTWTGTIKAKETGKTVNIFNQIDFIICQQRYKNLTTNARSYGGTILTSDHKLVITNFELAWHKVWRNRKTTEHAPKININSLINDTDRRRKYQDTLNWHLIKTQSENNSPYETWQGVKKAIQSAAQKSIGEVVSKNRKINRTPDLIITKLSNEQKEIRIRINNCKDENEKYKLKKERNKILHTIKKCVQKARNEELDQKAETINQAKSDDVMFRAVKALNIQKYENPQVEDKNGKIISNPNIILETVADHFKEKFKDINTPEIKSFTGSPKRFNKPISAKEIRTSLKSLNNNKASGEDQIHAECLKYGTPLLDEIIAKTINESFEKHIDIRINTGILIAIQKPGKPKGPTKNLRPITLLNTIRKTLSLIVLNRIRPKIEKYLSLNQSGFRPERSTADVVWTHKWLAAKTYRENITIKITGIDMSAAFDTINRNKLLDILSEIIENDELRIIHYLLSNTVLDTRINEANIHAPFTSNVGTPQGDGLSPVLFTVYLENALREVRKITNIPKSIIDKTIPREIAYADDIDFIGTEFIDVDEVQNILKRFYLMVNVDKTEYTVISRKEDEWKKTKKVGSLIGDTEDIDRRKILSNAALYKLKNLWIRNDKIKRKTRVKLYRALVKSILTYNCGTWALTDTEIKKLDAFHRNQLRKVLNIYYPNKISNYNLYKETNEKPISIHIIESRWRLFGHILRRHKDIPANKSMNFYFNEFGDRFVGRPKTTLPKILNKDLSNLNTDLYLTSEDDLENLRKLAQDRRKWSEMTKLIVNVAEASFSSLEE